MGKRTWNRIFGISNKVGARLDSRKSFYYAGNSEEEKEKERINIYAYFRTFFRI